MIDADQAAVPLHARLVVRLAAAALIVATVLASLAPGALGQTGADADGEDTEATSLPAPAAKVTAVDATTGDIAVELIGLAPDLAPNTVSVIVEGTEIDAVGVIPAGADERSAEVVVVMDTHVRGAAGNLLTAATDEVRSMLASMPAGTMVGVVAAGDGTIVMTTPTDDQARIDAAFDELSVRNSSALLSSIGRASELFTDDPTTVKSLVVVATGPDQGSSVAADQVRAQLLQKGVQVIAINHRGGEPALGDMVTRTAGLLYEPVTPDQLGAAIAAVGPHAAQRTVVGFTTGTDGAARSDVGLGVGDLRFDFSYPAGLRTVNPVQLAPQQMAGTGTFDLFATSTGLFIALGLAFVGISLGVWALGSMMASSEANLESMLSRYTDGPSDLSEEQVEELVVQSALLQRAVDLSESFAERQGFLARVEDMLERANLPIRAGEAMFILGSAVLLSGSLGLVLTKSVLAAALFGVVAAFAGFFFVRFKGQRRFKNFESQLPDTLQLLSGTLRAGYSLPQGLEAVSNEIADPMGQELRRAMTEARLGRELEEALSGVADRMSSPDFAWTVMAIGIQREVGGNLNELLMSVADTMVARDRLKREVSALTAEGKMSAGVLSFLPPGLGVIMWVINPGYISLLFTETMGNILLGLGILSATVGLAWMKKVITVDV